MTASPCPSRGASYTPSVRSAESFSQEISLIFMQQAYQSMAHLLRQTRMNLKNKTRTNIRDEVQEAMNKIKDWAVPENSKRETCIKENIKALYRAINDSDLSDKEGVLEDIGNLSYTQ